MTTVQPHFQYEIKFSMQGDGKFVFACMYNPHFLVGDEGHLICGWSAEDWPTLFKLMQQSELTK